MANGRERYQSLYKQQVKATPSWQLVGPSYRLAIKNYEAIGVLFFIPSLLQILGSFYLGTALSFNRNHHFLDIAKISTHNDVGFGLLVIWLALSIINYAPAIYFRLQAASGAKMPRLIECYRQGFKVFWKVLLSELAFVLITIIGFLALIIPGVLLFRRYVLVPYYAAQNPNLSFKEIFKLSASQSTPFMFHIYGTYLVVLLFNVLVGVAFGGFVLGQVVVSLVTYSVLFLPVLRYKEITNYFQKQPLTSVN